jgi:hypothetical protein
MLEPYDGKLSRTVLRGESGRKPRDLLDHNWSIKMKDIKHYFFCLNKLSIKNLFKGA